MAMSTRLIFPNSSFIASTAETKLGCKLHTLTFNPISRSSIPKRLNRSLCLVDQNSRFLSNSRRSQMDNTSKRDLVVHCGVLPGAPVPLPDSWQVWVLGAIIALVISFFSNKWGPLFKFTKEVEAVVDTIDNVTEVVESVAEQVEKVADEIGNQLPESGKLRGAFDFIENAAHQTAAVANIADDIIDKVEEVEKKVEELMEPVNNEEATAKAERENHNK